MPTAPSVPLADTSSSTVPGPLGPWVEWAFWQYTQNQNLVGIGIVDEDLFNGDILALTSQFVIGPSQDTTPPTADLSDPTNGGSIALSTLNGRSYIDVTFSDIGSALNTSTITDNSQEFTLSGTAASGVTINGSPTLVVSVSPNASCGAW